MQAGREDRERIDGPISAGREESKADGARGNVMAALTRCSLPHTAKDMRPDRAHTMTFPVAVLDLHSPPAAGLF